MFFPDETDGAHLEQVSYWFDFEVVVIQETPDLKPDTELRFYHRHGAFVANILWFTIDKRKETLSYKEAPAMQVSMS